jgi:hypothetical protein
VVLLLEVVNVGTDRRWAHLQVVVFTVGFSEIACHQPLSSVRVDVHEVRGHQVAVEDHHCQCPHTHVRSSCTEQDQSYQGCQSDHENLGCDTVQPDAGVVRVEEMGLLADGLALPGCVAVGDSAQMNVGVGVGSGQVEKTGATTADIFAAFAGSSATTLGVALYE